MGWRLFCEGKASITDLDEMSIDDAEKANDALDAWADAERRHYENKKPK